jgi:hypothetical protein
MLGPDTVLFAAALPSLAGPAPCPLAYVGLGPGQEFIPYFFALLGVVGLALVAVLQWPLLALRRFLSRARGGPTGGPNEHPATAGVPEKPGADTPAQP